MLQQKRPAHAAPPRPHQGRRTTGWAVAIFLIAATTVAVVVTALTRPGPPASATAAAIRTRAPAAPASVLGGSPASISDREATTLLAAAPAVVVAGATSPAAVTAAAAIARRAHAPLLLMPVGAAQLAQLRSAIRQLHPSAVLAAGVASARLTADLPGVDVVTSAAALPPAALGAPLRHVAVLVHETAGAPRSELATAAATTAAAAGAQVIGMPGYNPQTVPAAIRELAAARPASVIAIGAGFEPAGVLAARLAVAETGVQLPGGGQVLFPMRRIVALYGNPGTPALGVLGHQDLPASIARARAVAAQYNSLSRVPVVPAFEIIATVAEGSPGRDGEYSHGMSLRTLQPWVEAATKAGMFVTLDLQPGRASLLAQARRYQSLLRQPNVGLALDPEWKLGPHQVPLKQIGSVSIHEVNSVVTWLARLTASHHLPQKMLELHEFRLSMIRDIGRLDTRHRDLAIVINMDGQGSPGSKRQTWQAVVSHAPKGVYFGWKDFYVKDTPMIGPQRTIDRRPAPVLISYQ